MTDYVDLDDLRAWLGSDDTRDDVVLQTSITAASRWIDQRCGRTFGPADVAPAVRKFTPSSSALARIDDLSSSAGLVVETSTADDGVYDVTWAASDYLLEPVNGIENGIAGWPYTGLRAVGDYVFPTCTRQPGLQVTGLFGWSAVPADVAQACRLAANYFTEIRHAALGVAGFGDFGAVRVRDLPVVEMLLAPYRRRQVLVA